MPLPSIVPALKEMYKIQNNPTIPNIFLKNIIIFQKIC